MKLLKEFENLTTETERYLCKCEQYGIDDAVKERGELKSTLSLSSDTHDDILAEIEQKKEEIVNKIKEMIN